MIFKKLPAGMLSIISALLAFIAIAEINFIIGWICFVPLFISTFNATPKKHFKQGFIFGFIFSCLAYSWMISGAERFTGYNFLYGAAIFLACAFFVSLYWGLVLLCFSWIKIKKSKGAVIINSFSVASLFCVFEFFLSWLANGMPWFNFHAGNALTGNLYAIQPASFLGIYSLSFIVVYVNYIIAVCVAEKQWKKLRFPVIIILAYILCGYSIFQNFKNNFLQGDQVMVAITAENIPPDIKWDDANGNMLVHRLLDLNKAAVAQNPGIILWSESAVPWTYRKDDDLVNEILKESSGANVTHILGINTEVDSNIVNNSAYCFLPNGEVSNRYDKQILLSFIEKPLSKISIPFFSNKGFLVSNDKTHSVPLETPFGKAGIMICNESVTENAAFNSVNKNAVFLCNMSNDGWFNNTYIPRFHFLSTRLRAVETRKDIAVNCNNGYSGFIGANGSIVQQKKDTNPFILTGYIKTNNYKTLAVKMPFLFAYLCGSFIVLLILNRFVKKNKPAIPENNRPAKATKRM